MDKSDPPYEPYVTSCRVYIEVTVESLLVNNLDIVIYMCVCPHMYCRVVQRHSTSM